MKINCDYCNKEFHRKESQIAKSKTHYCSYECFRNGHKRVSRKCEQCGKETYNEKFCCHKCSSNWRTGSNHHKWNGGRGISKEGYVYLWSGKYRSKIEHRAIYENLLGRKLVKGETIHHKNGIRNDNRIENLELWNKAQPAGQRIEDKIKWAKELLESYGYIIIPQQTQNSALEAQGAKPPQ